MNKCDKCRESFRNHRFVVDNVTYCTPGCYGGMFYNVNQKTGVLYYERRKPRDFKKERSRWMGKM